MGILERENMFRKRPENVVFVLEGSYIFLSISSNLMVALNITANICGQGRKVNYGKICIVVYNVHFVKSSV